MNLEIMQYSCKNCANKFEAVALPESAYGEFLLWSRNGEAAYLDALADATYTEVENIISALSESEIKIQKKKISDILQAIYGQAACDTDSKNAPFSILAQPPCPKCGSSDMESWDYKNPPQIVECDASPVTHHEWNSMNMENKIEKVRALVVANI